MSLNETTSDGPRSLSQLPSCFMQKEYHGSMRLGATVALALSDANFRSRHVEASLLAFFQPSRTRRTVEAFARPSFPLSRGPFPGHRGTGDALRSSWPTAAATPYANPITKHPFSSISPLSTGCGFTVGGGAAVAVGFAPVERGITSPGGGA